MLKQHHVYPLHMCVQPRWHDLFELFPSLVRAVPLDTFFSLAPAMQPRYYRYAHNELSVVPGPSSTNA
jgi:hypothetical protein